MILKLKSVWVLKGLLRSETKITYNTNPESYMHTPVGKFKRWIQVKDSWEIKKKIKVSEIQENISEEADELLGTTLKQMNKNTQTNKTHLNSALSSKISCTIMS